MTTAVATATTAAALSRIVQDAIEADVFADGARTHSNEPMKALLQVIELADVMRQRVDVIDAAGLLVRALRSRPWLASCTVELSRQMVTDDDGRSGWAYKVDVEDARHVAGAACGGGDVPAEGYEADGDVGNELDGHAAELGAVLRLDGETTSVSVLLSRTALASVLDAPHPSSAAAARVLWPEQMAAIDEELRLAARQGARV